MITQRQAQILAAIVKEYSQTGNPVGSEELVGRYHFPVSSATVRNEMQALEETGLIMQPHTSAGRIPTDKGYRYFINKLMHHLELTATEQRHLRQELLRLQREYLELGRSITKLLAEKAEGAAFAMLPESAVSTSGISKVIGQGQSRAEIQELAYFLDELDHCGKALIQKDMHEVKTYVGSEAPLPVKLSDFSLVVSKVRFPTGEQGMIGIVGPKRMKYARNISLVEYISKLLAGGLVLFIIFNF
jgi:transcriptional regulator of heat shock response